MRLPSGTAQLGAWVGKAAGGLRCSQVRDNGGVCREVGARQRGGILGGRQPTERQKSRLQPRLLALDSWKEGAVFLDGKGEPGGRAAIE